MNREISEYLINKIYVCFSLSKEKTIKIELDFVEFAACFGDKFSTLSEAIYDLLGEIISVEEKMTIKDYEIVNTRHSITIDEFKNNLSGFFEIEREEI